MRVRVINPDALRAFRGKRSREVIAHELRRRGHGTDAKALWRYETGRSQPHARILPDYAAVLGAGSVDELYGDEDDEESDPLAALMHALRVYVRHEAQSNAPTAPRQKSAVGASNEGG